jgi:copper(I)-binding protein
LTDRHHGRKDTDYVRHRLVAAAYVLAAALALVLVSGCSAGQITQTSSQVSGVDGASGRAAAIVVRNAAVAAPTGPQTDIAYSPGADAPLKMVIVNEGSAPDRLLRASSPLANTVNITGDASLPGYQALSVGQPGAIALPNTKRIDMVLTGLREPLKSGGVLYEVTLFFERAGPLRLEVPVANPDESAE